MTEGPGLLDSNRPTFKKKEPKKYLVLLPFPCRAKKAVALLVQWVRDQVLPFLDHFPSVAGQKAANNCPYNQKNGHPLKHCIQKAIWWETQSIWNNAPRGWSNQHHESPFPKNQNWGKAHVKMASHSGVGAKKVILKASQIPTGCLSMYKTCSSLETSTTRWTLTLRSP